MKNTKKKKREMIKVNVKKLEKSAKMPTWGSDQAAGFDLYANESLRIPGRGVRTVGTGLAFEVLHDDYYIQLKERSGISVNTPLSLKAGVIDTDYRGEVKIVFQNVSDFPYDVEKGDKLVQATLEKRQGAEFIEVKEFENPDTKRGDKGFGSSDEEE